MTSLELVPWRGRTVPLLSQTEVSRSTIQDYLGWMLDSQRYMGPPMPAMTYGNRPAEPISNSFEGFVRGMLYADTPVAAVEAYRLRVFGQAPLLYQEIVDGRAGELFDDPALDRLRAPWPGGTLSDLMKRSLVYGDFGGNAFILDLDDELVLVRPDWVEIVLAKREHRGGQVGWKQVGIMYYEGGVRVGDGVPFLPGEYAHFVPGLPDPLATFRGMSWLTTLVREVQADKSAGDHKTAFFENAASPNLAVSLPKEITPTQFEEFVEKMDAHHKGAMNAYKTLYTAGGADVTVIGANMQQMDFSGVQGKGETRIANAGGISPVLLSFSEGMQGSSLNAGNYVPAKRNVVDTTMRDLWQNFVGSVQQMDAFKPKPKSRLWYDGRDIPFLHEDAKDLAEIQQTRSATINSYITAGWEPETAQAAVAQDDVTLLKHTGAFSVQLQPPGTTAEGADPAAADEVVADEYAQVLEGLRSDLAWRDEIMRNLDEDDEDLARAGYYNVRVAGGHKGGGRFRKLSDIVGEALNDWLDGKGDADDPLEPFTHGSPATARERLRKVSKEFGIEPRRGASVEELKLGILKDAKARFKGDRAAPKPSAKFTLKGKAHRDKDVSVYTDADHETVILYEENERGEIKPRPLVQLDDLAGLEKWADDNGESELAGWAAKERGGDKAPAKKAAPAKRAPAKKAAPKADGLDSGSDIGLSGLADENGLSAKGTREELLARLREKGVTAPPEWADDYQPAKVEPKLRELDDKDLALLKSASNPGDLRLRPTQTGAARQFNGRIDLLSREGYIKKERGSSHYSLTDAGREALGGSASPAKKATPAKKAARPPLDPDATLADLRGMDSRDDVRDALDLHTMDDIKKMMPEGMSKSGKKRDLVDRLAESLKPETGSAAPAKAAPSVAPASQAKDKRVATMAGRLHEDWRKTRLQDGSSEPRVKATKDEAWIAAHGTDQVDIANTDFADLPDDWKAENQAAAEVIDNILESNGGKVDLNDEQVRNRVGEEIHKEWLKRNDWAKGGELDVPFADLPKSEQDKDIDQLRVAMGGDAPVAPAKTAAPPAPLGRKLEPGYKLQVLPALHAPGKRNIKAVYPDGREAHIIQGLTPDQARRELERLESAGPDVVDAEYSKNSKATSDRNTSLMEAAVLKERRTARRRSLHLSGPVPVRQQLAALGLDTSGTMTQLVNRLLEAEGLGVPKADGDQGSPKGVPAKAVKPAAKGAAVYKAISIRDDASLGAVTTRKVPAYSGATYELDEDVDLAGVSGGAVRDAVGDYADQGYQHVNAALRAADGDIEAIPEVAPSGAGLIGSHYSRDRVMAQVEGIDAAMGASRTKAPVVVHRGVVDPAKAFGSGWSDGGDNAGLEWTDPSYVSTSADDRVARKFSTAGVEMNIHVPEDIGAIGIENAQPGLKFEREVLLERGLRYRITSDRKVGGRRVIDVEVVVPAGPPAKDSHAEAAVAVHWDQDSSFVTANLGELSTSDQAAIDEALGNWTWDKDPGDNAEPAVNGVLRGRADPTPQRTRDIELMDLALAHSRTTQDTEVYRGFTSGSTILPSDWQQRDLTGLTWDNPAFTSTTPDRQSAEMYVGPAGDRGFAIRVRLPKGSPALAVRDVAGGSDDEGEIVLPRGSSFRVVRDNGVQGGVRWLDVEIVRSGNETPKQSTPSTAASIADLPDDIRALVGDLE